MTDMGLAGALIGHLAGDYLFQNDWMAAGKKRSSAICAVHCLTWTACVLAAWLPNAMASQCPWLVAWLFGTHFAIDRWGFVKWWMRNMGQGVFMDKLGPWSLIVVDNTWHAVTILLAAMVLSQG